MQRVCNVLIFRDSAPHIKGRLRFGVAIAEWQSQTALFGHCLALYRRVGPTIYKGQPSSFGRPSPLSLLPPSPPHTHLELIPSSTLYSTHSHTGLYMRTPTYLGHRLTRTGAGLLWRQGNSRREPREAQYQVSNAHTTARPTS